MVAVSELVEQFDEFGIEAPDEVLARCIDLCITYNIHDATDFVEQWMAYSVSHLDGAPPTLDYLQDMERKELVPLKNKKAAKIQSIPPSTPILDAIDDEPDDDFIDSYIGDTPKAPKKVLPRTPIAQKKSNAVLFSPASYSPMTGTPRSAGGEGSGKAVYTFGKSDVVNTATWTTSGQQTIQIKQLLTWNNEPLTTKAKYMYDSLMDKTLILGDHLYETAIELCKTHLGQDSSEYDLLNVDSINQSTVKILGHIACEFDGKLDNNSVLIVGTDELKLRTARLNFNNMKSFSVFPGQTVIASGVNPRGETFYANEILSSRMIQPPKQPEITEPLTLVIAAGPFTHSDNLIYDPLQELMVYCKDRKPDVLILVGPFIDADHKLITTNALCETFDQCFEKMVASVAEMFEDITICMVSSAKDAVSHVVYPTPPNSIKRSFPNVHMLPDPCIIDVNGLKMGITSTDIFSHLLDVELIRNAGEKVKRVVNYMLNEKSFYPLHPPAMDVSLDSDLASKFARLDEPPNILVLPSRDKCFIRDINNCLAINPGTLWNSTSSGLFARISVHPPKEGAKLAEYVASQVVRI